MVVVFLFLFLLFAAPPDGDDTVCVDGPSILSLCFLGLLRTVTAVVLLSLVVVLVALTTAADAVLRARGDVLLSNPSSKLLLFVFFAIGVVIATAPSKSS